jgi:hypothetical protein
MTKSEIVAELLANGWTQDRFGHYKIKLQRDYRIKMGAISCRLQVKSMNDWINITTTGYYKDCVIRKNSKGIRSMLIGKSLIKMENIPCM